MKMTKNKDDQQLYEKGQGNGATLASPDLFLCVPAIHVCIAHFLIGYYYY